MRRFRRLLDIRVAAGLIIAGVVFVLLVDIAIRDSPDESGDRFERIASFVEYEMGESDIPGVALAVVDGDGSVHGAGLGNDGRGNQVTADTVFWIGSNTKSFTALATMQLVEQGQVGLDAPVTDYLPDFRSASPGDSAQITIHQLLNQTSGFSRQDGIDLLLESDEDDTLEEAVASLESVELNRPPGESFEYSNINFVVLGLLIEVVSGTSWPEYIQANIFDPLGMANSYLSLEEAQDAGLTELHRVIFGFARATEPEYLPALAPTGYIYSSVADMARYLSMYLGGGELEGERVLSPEGIDGMLAGESPPASSTLMSHTFDFRYGRGWFVGPFGAAGDARWHLGNLPSFTAWTVLLPETSQGVVVLINTGSQMELAGANEVMSRIPIGVVNILRDEDPPSGISLWQFYVVFNGLVILVLTLQAWSFVRVARRATWPQSPQRRALMLVPFAWEIGLAGLLLVAGPLPLGVDWATSLDFLPDLALSLIAVCVLWLATGIARAVRLGRSAFGGATDEGGPPRTQPAPGPP